jgi:hypothetical protein
MRPKSRYGGPPGRVGVNLAYAGGMASMPSGIQAIWPWLSSSMSSPDRGTDVGRWRADRDGHQRVHGVRRLRDPVASGLSVTSEAFVPADHPGQILSVFTAGPGAPPGPRVRLLTGPRRRAATG